LTSGAGYANIPPAAAAGGRKTPQEGRMRKVCMLCRRELENAPQGRTGATEAVSHGLCGACAEVYDGWMEGTIPVRNVAEAKEWSLKVQARRG
jgi:hypothetical protein